MQHPSEQQSHSGKVFTTMEPAAMLLNFFWKTPIGKLTIVDCISMFLAAFIVFFIELFTKTQAVLIFCAVLIITMLFFFFGLYFVFSNYFIREGRFFNPIAYLTDLFKNGQVAEGKIVTIEPFKEGMYIKSPFRREFFINANIICWHFVSAKGQSFFSAHICQFPIPSDLQDGSWKKIIYFPEQPQYNVLIKEDGFLIPSEQRISPGFLAYAAKKQLSST